METLTYIAAINTIILYCVCHKWTNYSQHYCMFCTMFWVSVIGAIGLSVYNFTMLYATVDIISDVCNAALITILTNVMYFYVKHLHE